MDGGVARRSRARRGTRSLPESKRDFLPRLRPALAARAARGGPFKEKPQGLLRDHPPLPARPHACPAPSSRCGPSGRQRLPRRAPGRSARLPAHPRADHPAAEEARHALSLERASGRDLEPPALRSHLFRRPAPAACSRAGLPRRAHGTPLHRSLHGCGHGRSRPFQRTRSRGRRPQGSA